MTKQYSEPIGIFLFFAVIAAAIVAPLTSNDVIPKLADYINHLASIIQAKAALAEGQFPLRIAPLEQAGWRYPLYQFYSPTGYTIAGLLYQWLGNPLMAYKYTVWGALVFGGIYMQRLAYAWVKSTPAALLAGVVYLTAPYYLIVVDRLGDFSESVALGILPMVLFYTVAYCKQGSYKALLLASAAWYLLITIHIVTFVYTALFVAILSILLKKVIRAGIAFGFGCVLAMWFLAPIHLFASYFMITTTFSKHAGFLNYSPLLPYLLSPATILTQGSQSALTTLHPTVGWPILLAVGCGGYVFLMKESLANKHTAIVSSLLVAFLLAFLLAWSPWDFWRFLPQMLWVGQYSWRLLGQAIWIGALLFAWAVCWLCKNSVDKRNFVFGVLLLMMASQAWYADPGGYRVSLPDFIKNPLLIFNQNAYSLDFNRHAQLVDLIDKMPLYSLMDDAILQLNTPYYIPRALMNVATKPVLSLHARAPMLAENRQLVAKINGVVIATLHLKPGLFDWNIPLDRVKAHLKEESMLALTLDMLPKRKPDIAIGYIFLGFQDPAHILDATQVKPHCHQEKATTVCQIAVPKTVTLLELPILYYPQLLHIELNGKSISYKSVLYQDRLIAAVQPIAGQMNTVRMRFQGLPWANWISLFAWWAWGVMLVCVLWGWSRVRLH